ncbi:MAG: hypothetical protein M0Z94_06600 [Dehalococcoidales bacterium]|nr:hypothetical protein [Dehalococcoidales bacterium]
MSGALPLAGMLASVGLALTGAVTVKTDCPRCEAAGTVILVLAIVVFFAAILWGLADAAQFAWRLTR